MTTKFDLHLSAYRLAPDTIRKVESLGFSRDEFANNARCDTTAYHGTFRGSKTLPDQSLWDELEGILSADASFVGGLEEEEFIPAETIHLRGTSLAAPSLSRPLGIAQPTAGTYKACDIHININLTKSPLTALKFVEALQLASFDKPQDDGIHRVFSATCESVESGRALFKNLSEYLLRVPGLVGKMKFERTTRFLRLPPDAPVLPIISDSRLSAWFLESKSGAM